MVYVAQPSTVIFERWNDVKISWNENAIAPTDTPVIRNVQRDQSDSL